MRLCSELLLCCLAVLQLGSGYPNLAKRHADFESVRTHLERDHSNIEDDLPDKYFHEALFGSHYDGRFADKPLPHDVRQTHLTFLIQTYLSTMNTIGTETWLMHGSLLGWYWNRKVMPWDDDIDVSISEKSMHHLASFYNMTVHHFTIPGIENGRDFLLEVNPHYMIGEVSDEDNRIDARWVDTDTGLFIDITTLRRNLTAEALGIEGAMMIKDKHHYMYDDIYPLRETEFEGAPAKVPFAYADLLVEEYGDQALTKTNFHNHRFDTEKQEWLPLSCKYLGTCRDPRFGPPDSIAQLAKNLSPGFGKHTWDPADPETRPPPYLARGGNNGAPVGALNEAAMRVAGGREYDGPL